MDNGQYIVMPGTEDDGSVKWHIVVVYDRKEDHYDIIWIEYDGDHDCCDVRHTVASQSEVDQMEQHATPDVEALFLTEHGDPCEVIHRVLTDGQEL